MVAFSGAGCSSNSKREKLGGLLDVDPPPELGDADKKDFDEWRRVYHGPNLAAWEEKKEEILASEGRRGQYFLIAFLGIAEQNPEYEIERQDRACGQLADVLSRIADLEDDWGVRLFVVVFCIENGPTFHSTVWIPVVEVVGKPLYKYVLALLEHPDLNDFQRMAAYQGIGATGGAEAVPILWKAYEGYPGRDGDSFRAACVQGLGKGGSEEAIPYLVRALEDRDSVMDLIHSAAFEGLLLHPSTKAVEPLIRLLGQTKKFKEKSQIVARLEAVTRVEGLGMDAKAWEAWYKRNKEKLGS